MTAYLRKKYSWLFWDYGNNVASTRCAGGDCKHVYSTGCEHFLLPTHHSADVLWVVRVVGQWVDSQEILDTSHFVQLSEVYKTWALTAHILHVKCASNSLGHIVVGVWSKEGFSYIKSWYYEVLILWDIFLLGCEATGIF